MGALTDAELQMMVNAYTTQRASLFGGIDYARSSDAKHSKAWASYGYKDSLAFDDYYSMYARMGIGGQFVELAARKTWAAMPKVALDPEDPNDPLAKEFEELSERISLQSLCKMLDERQRVGRYAGILFELRDGQQLDTPVGSVSKIDGLQSCKVLFEDQLEPSDWIKNTSSPDYLKPTKFLLQEQAFSSNNPDGGRSLTVDASRVVIWSEGQTGSDIYGTSCLERPFNSLVTLEKIIGAGGEGFWKAARGMVRYNLNDGVNVNDLMAFYGAKTQDELRDKFNEGQDQENRGFDVARILSNMTAEDVTIDLPDGKSPFENALLDVAAAGGYPSAILLGNQMGVRASEKDEQEMEEMIHARRISFGTPSLRKMIDALMEIGILTKYPRYRIKWPDPNAKSMEEQANIFSTLTTALKGYGMVPDFGKVAQVAGMDKDKADLMSDVDNIDMRDGLPGEE